MSCVYAMQMPRVQTSVEIYTDIYTPVHAHAFIVCR